MVIFLLVFRTRLPLTTPPTPTPPPRFTSLDFELSPPPPTPLPPSSFTQCTPLPFPSSGEAPLPPLFYCKKIQRKKHTNKSLGAYIPATESKATSIRDRGRWCNKKKEQKTSVVNVKTKRRKTQNGGKSCRFIFSNCCPEEEEAKETDPILFVFFNLMRSPIRDTTPYCRRASAYPCLRVRPALRNLALCWFAPLPLPPRPTHPSHIFSKTHPHTHALTHPHTTTSWSSLSPPPTPAHHTHPPPPPHHASCFPLLAL